MSTIQRDEIWLLIDSLRFGGIETHVCELAQGLRQQGTPVRVVFTQKYGESSPLKPLLVQNNVACSYLCELSTAKTQLSQLRFALKCHQPKLIHAHGYKASLLSKLACKLMRESVAQVSTYHAGETPTGRVWLYDFIDRYSAFLSDKTLVVSQKIGQKIPFSSIHINNFIATEHIKPKPGQQIAFVGRLSHEKAPERFVGLAHQFSSLTYLNLEPCTPEFHCYGAGPLRESLEKMAGKDKEQLVHFHGHQTDMNAVWPNISVLVLCSRYEGLPMTALEAMARGIPVISTNVGDLDQLIQHGVNGYLADNHEMLAEHLKHWLELPEDARQKMRHCAIEKVTKSFSTKAIIPQLLVLYSQARWSSCRRIIGYHTRQ